MAVPNLGRLETIDLRSVFSSESLDFTPWLAREENLALLAESIGIELELESTEKGVGPFRADILCKDTSCDAWVLVENQIERTDHTHLGQLLTYAAGLEAITIIWIAQKFTEEHRAALDWLNERTDDKVNLFGIEVELWRIGGSLVAPRFNIISKPNYWSRSVKELAEGNVTEYQQSQREFWSAFREYMETSGSILKCPKPPAGSNMTYGIGVSGANLTSTITMFTLAPGQPDGMEIRVELTLWDDRAKERFAILEAHKQEVEEKLGGSLVWLNTESLKRCRIVNILASDFRDQSLWSEQHEWLKQNLEAFYRVFAPLVKMSNK